MQEYKVISGVRQTILALGLGFLCFSAPALSDDAEPQWRYQEVPGLSANRLPQSVSASQLPHGMTQLSLAFAESENVTLTIETTLEPVNDERGGYGSEIYEHLNDFQVQGTGQRSSAWIGWQNRYDVEAFRVDPADLRISKPSGEPGDTSFHLDLKTPEAVTVYYFSGGRERAHLEQIGLQDVLLYEMWTPFKLLCQFIWSVLLWLQSISGSWGLAILLLALVIRIFTIPITRISLEQQKKALEQQNRIAAKVAELKKTSSGIELSEKMVALYEAESYDHLAPFKGMMGLFIQIPILIALFTVIGEMSVLKGQSFLWIDDLSLSDRLLTMGVDLPFFGGYFNLLPCLMALATILSTWASSFDSKVPVSGGSLYGMALVFFVFFYSFPAALVLYWFASNFFQLLQQLIELAVKR